MAYRFVHTADIHLDSPLRTLALRDASVAELIGNATRRAFIRTVDLCCDEQVDALLLAGDLYDGDQTSMKTARFLAEQIHRLHEGGIRVFIVRGNHDALSRITKELTFPDSVKVFGGRAESIVIDRADGAFPVTIHGLSFAQPHAPDSLVGKYKPLVEGALNIGMMHTSLAGAPGHDLYAPCSVVELEATGFSYWALGHIHKRSITEGKCTIVMPGTPQGRDINEAGAKSVTLVTVADDRSIRLEERVTSVAQFERVSVDATGLDDWGELVSAIGKALERARQHVIGEYLVARVQLIGTTPLAWRIRRDLDLIKTEADDRASTIGGCWVEKLDIDCHASGGASDAAADPIGELQNLVNLDVVKSEAYRAEVAKIADELRAQLPPESRTLLGTDEAAFGATVAQAVDQGCKDILARLRASAESGSA